MSDEPLVCFNCAATFDQRQRLKWYYCENKKRLICRDCVAGKNRKPNCDYDADGQRHETHVEKIIKTITTQSIIAPGGPK